LLVRARAAVTRAEGTVHADEARAILILLNRQQLDVQRGRAVDTTAARERLVALEARLRQPN
jgi:hypothetical protein